MNVSPHVTKETLSRIGLNLPNFAVTRRAKIRMYATMGTKDRFNYPLVGYNMWRGMHSKYQYTKASLCGFGEGDAKNIYHQHFAHAKDVNDYGKGGREFQYLSVKRGKLLQKPLPTVQYTGDAKDKPTWLFKSWHGSLGNMEVWQREVQYPAHVPEHLGAKRPLATMAPRAAHPIVHNANMDKITVVICPYNIGYGDTIQKAVMGFYRRCVSFASPFPKDKVQLYYSIEPITPKIEVTWADGSIYEPPILEGCKPRDLVQMVMENSWIAGDRMAAAGKNLQPIVIDDYKWQQMALVKKKKKAAGK